MDGISEEMNRVTSKKKYQELKGDNKSMEQQSNEWWQYYLDRENSVITDLFQGQLVSRIVCKKCGNASLAFDNFLDISVSFPRSTIRITGRNDLESCLQTFIKKEQMEPCGFKCSKCKVEDNFEKDMSIYRFPQVLVVHLKRFYKSFMRSEKINTMISVPQELDMRPFAPHSGNLLAHT